MTTNSLGNKFMNRMFRKVGGLVWELTTGKLGISTDQGIYTLQIDGENCNIAVNPFDSFGIDVPAFGMATTFDKVEIGDIVVGDTQILGWVIAKKESSLVLLDKTGMRKQYNPPKVQVLGSGMGDVLVVKNLFATAGGEAGAAGIQSALLPLLMLGDGDVDFDKIMPFLLMSGQTGQGGQAMNPLMLMMMAGKGKGSDIDPMMMMAMMGGMGGQNGVNPMMMMAMMGGLGKKTKSAPVTLNPVPALQRCD